MTQRKYWLGVVVSAVLGLTGSASSALAAMPVLPVISGLTLQLEADRGLTLDTGNNVTAWADQSGNGHDATAVASYAAQVNSGSMNGIAVPTFSDSTLLISGQPVTSQQFSIFGVATTHQGGGADGFREILSNWSGGNSVTSVFLGTVGDSSVPSTTMRFTDAVGGATDPVHTQTGVGNIGNPAAGFVLSAISGATDASVYLGQSTVTTTAALPGRDLSGDWLVGSQGGSFELWSGEIGAILVYNRALTGAERTAVISYLGEKYLGIAPVPEPAEWLLLVVGLGLLGALARKRAG